MKLSFCMLLPSLASGFAFHGSLSTPIRSSGSLVMMATPPEEQLKTEPTAPTGAEAGPAVASADSSPAPEGENVPTDQTTAQASPQTASKPNTFVQTRAAPTFSATAPAGMPPEVNQGTFQKYRTLDQEMNARAAQSGFARAQGVRASMSATNVSDNSSSGYYKYQTLASQENEKAAQSGFAKAQGVKASMSATDVSDNSSSGYYKYMTLSQIENARAARSGFAATKARATFSATDATNNQGSGNFFKYKTLNQEDNERALNASYRQVTYSATQATDSASGSSNIPVVEKKADQDDAPEAGEEKMSEE